MPKQLNRRPRPLGRIMGMIYAFLFAFFFLFLIHSQIDASVLSGTRYFVAHDGTGAGGQSWGTAFPTLQQALDTAVAGDEVWVKAGLYTPTLELENGDARSATFSMTQGVQLYGSFAGTEEFLHERDMTGDWTVLSGDLSGDDAADSDGVLHNSSGITGDNAYHVVYLLDLLAGTHETRLDGFVITGGAADGPEHAGNGFDCIEECGGGIYNYNSDVQYANLIIRGNKAELGGGVYVNRSELSFANVQFIGNTVQGTGAGLKTTEGIIDFYNVLFVGNRADVKQGANGKGGAVSSFGSSTRLTFINSAFVFNSAYQNGGALDNRYNVRVAMTNTIAWGNETDTTDTANFYNFGPSFPAITYAAYSLISDTEVYAGEGNITSTISPFVSDPSAGADGTWGTADDIYGDLTLKSDSVALDQGANGLLPFDSLDLDVDGDTAEVLPLDLAGLPRVSNTIVDLGPYELQVMSAPTITIIPSAISSATLTWDDDSGCEFSIYHSATPYDNYLNEGNDISSPYSLDSHGTGVDFYYLSALCGGETVESDRIGVFEFALALTD